jgi:hypothetical protein
MSANKLLKAYRAILKRLPELAFGIVIIPTLILALILSLKLTCRIFCGADFYAALGELLLVIVIAVGEVIAFFELRHIAKDRDFHSWVELQRVWTDHEFVQQRGVIFKRVDSREAFQSPWGTHEETAKWACRKMDEFAHLAQFFGKKKVLLVWDDPLAKAWIVLEEIVKEERNSTNWQEKWSAFSELGQMAVDKVVSEGRDPRQKWTTVPQYK